MFKRFVARLLIALQIYGSFLFGATETEVVVNRGLQYRSLHVAPYQDGMRFISHRSSDGDNDEEPDKTRLLNDVYIGPYKNTKFSHNGIVRDLEGTYQLFNGLNIFTDNDGHVLVQGKQDDFTKPICLSSEYSIVLNNVFASALQITAPLIVNHGFSLIQDLRLEGIVSGNSLQKPKFTNRGNLTSKELFLRGLSSGNAGTIATQRLSINGDLESVGIVISDELILEEDAYLKLGDKSNTAIKTLTLNNGSHLENSATSNEVNLDSLASLGSSLTNHGSLMIGETVSDSAFKTITNRHFMSFGSGAEIKANTFENAGTFMAEQSELLVSNGRNLGAIKVNGLDVKKSFTNSGTGIIDTQLVSGAGDIESLGKIETDHDLAIGIKRFTNNGSVKARSITGLSGLEKLTNADDAIIEATQNLSFDNATKIDNSSTFKARDMTLVGDNTAQTGEIFAKTIHLIGGEFVNQGEIEVDHLTAESGLLNKAVLITNESTALGNGGLANTAKALATLNRLKLVGDTAITNYGKLAITGIDTALGILKLTNSGTAIVDGLQTLPKASEHSPENLARVATSNGPVTWENYLYSHLRTDHEFENQNPLQSKIFGSQFESSYQQILASCAAYAKSSHPAVGAALVVESSNIPAVKLQLLNQIPGQLTLKSGKFEFVGDTGLVNAGTLALDNTYLLWLTDNPGAFNPGTWVVKGSLGLLGYIDARFEALQVGGTLYVDTHSDAFKALEGLIHAKADRVSLKAQAMSALPTELADLHPIRTQKQYETEHFKKDMLPKLYAKMKLEYQSSYEKYIASFNKGYQSYIDIRDAFAQAGNTLEGWIQQTSSSQGIPFAKLYTEPERHELISILAEKFKLSCPWPLELDITNDIGNALNISAPELKIRSRIFRTVGNIFAHSGVLDLSAESGLEIASLVGSGRGINLMAKNLSIQSRADIPGAVVPNIFYKSQEFGLYSEGPVTLKVGEVINNHYGVIQGTSLEINSPQLINTAGLINATDTSLSSTINVTAIKNIRDEQRSYTSYSYRYGVTYQADGKNWCYCCGTRPHYCGNGCRQQVANTNYFETSNEGIISSQGDLSLTYNTLEMLVSRITCGGNLTFISQDKIHNYKNHTDITNTEIPTLPGATTMTKRNGHVNHITAKKDLTSDLVNANLATSIYGQNINVKAAFLTLQSLGIQPKQQNHIIDLFSQTHGKSTFKSISSGNHQDGFIDLSLPFQGKLLPTSLVLIGKDANTQIDQSNTIDLQMTIGALEHVMGSQFYTLYRGVSGLGCNISDFFKSTSDFVRAHKDTVSQRRAIKSGKETQEREVLINPVLTEQDLLDSGLPTVFLKFSETLNSLESAKQVDNILLQAKQKASVIFTMKPDSGIGHGIKAPGDVLLTSDSGLSLSTNVNAKNIAVVSKGTNTIGSDVIHRQTCLENYHQILDRTTLDAENQLLIEGNDVYLNAINTHSGVETNIIAKTGMIVDQSVGTTSYNVTHHSSKDESTTIRTTHIHQNVSEHSSGGRVNMKAMTGILQQGVKLTNTELDAPIIIHDDVHDQHMVEIETIKNKKVGGVFGSVFGMRERKTTNHNSFSSFSKGCVTAGEIFIANARERFKTVNPTFQAKTNEITANEVEIKVGVNKSQSYTQSTYQGPVWNKSSISTEKHTLHINPKFEGNVIIHSPNVILEKVRGSQGLFDKISSDTPIQFIDIDDIHESTHKSQKTLSAGASLILKLAITLMTANPMSGAGLSACMINAGYGTLCSEAATCLIEKDGNPAKAIDELGKRNIVKTIGMSMATAGLTKGFSDALGVPVKGLSLTDYAKRELIKSTVNTVLAVTIDKQDLEQAMKQGLITAGLNTIAAFGANKVGDAKENKTIGSSTHKLLHGGLGAISGGITSELSGNGFKDGVLSGGFGGMIGTMMSDGLDKTDMDKERVSQMSDLLTTILALGTGLNPVTAYQTAHNANENNYLKHLPTLQALGIIDEGEEPYEGDGDELELYQRDHTKGGYVIQRNARTNDREDGRRARSLSPTIHDSWLQTTLVRPVKKMGSNVFKALPTVVQDTAHNIADWTGSQYKKSHVDLALLKDKKTADQVFKGSTLDRCAKLGRVTAFGALDLVSTGVEYTKSYARKGLRATGTKANDAQDAVDILSTALVFTKGSSFIKATGNIGEGITAQTLKPKPTITKSSFKSFEAEDLLSTRTKLFVTDEVFQFKADRVRLINGRMPINSKYAGNVYFEKLPRELQLKYPHGIPFTGTGHPDFSRYAVKKVDTEITGKNCIDFPAADKAAGFAKKPSGYTWHHHENGKTMMLVPKDLHAAVDHTGGVAVIKGLK